MRGRGSLLWQPVHLQLPGGRHELQWFVRERRYRPNELPRLRRRLSDAQERRARLWNGGLRSELRLGLLALRNQLPSARQ